MKATLLTLLAALCFTLLLLGNMHWDKKTTISTAKTVDTNEEVEQTQTTNTKEQTKAESPLDTLQSYMTNWPEESKDAFVKAYNEKKAFQIAIAGSTANKWVETVSANLSNTFGNTIEINELAYDLTSSEFLNEEKMDDIIKADPDLVLLEPFTLKDNGLVTIEDSLANLQTVINSVKESNAYVSFILQPPHPLYNAKFYPVQVQELKTYAESNQITYIDHWTSWPNPNTEEILPYLTEDRSEPSEKGYELWAKTVSDFMITKH